MIEINLKKLHPNAMIPQKATELAGGWDVIVTEIIQKDDDFVICKLGFALDFPEGYKLTLVPRSSLTNTKWVLQNTPGLGDADYRGEYQLRFRALPCGFNYVPSNGIMGSGYYGGESKLTYDEFPYKVGERVGQVYLEEVMPLTFNVVDELTNTVRGEGGYGHTGNK